MPTTVDEFFRGYEASRPLFEALLKIVNEIGPTECKATRSQIAFHRKKPFAWVWIPGKYLHGKVAPLVLSLSLSHRDPSPRWKEIVEPAHGRFMHHLELYSMQDIDDEVCAWLQSAYRHAEGSQ